MSALPVCTWQPGHLVWSAMCLPQDGGQWLCPIIASPSLCPKEHCYIECNAVQYRCRVGVVQGAIPLYPRCFWPQTAWMHHCSCFHACPSCTWLALNSRCAAMASAHRCQARTGRCSTTHRINKVSILHLRHPLHGLLQARISVWGFWRPSRPERPPAVLHCRQAPSDITLQPLPPPLQPLAAPGRVAAALL